MQTYFELLNQDVFWEISRYLTPYDLGNIYFAVSNDIFNLISDNRIYQDYYQNTDMRLLPEDLKVNFVFDLIHNYELLKYVDKVLDMINSDSLIKFDLLYSKIESIVPIIYDKFKREFNSVTGVTSFSISFDSNGWVLYYNNDLYNRVINLSDETVKKVLIGIISHGVSFEISIDTSYYNRY